jgi:predicted permease
VFRLLLTQSVFVVTGGAVLGIVLTRLVLPWLRHLELNRTQSYFMARVELDASVLAVTAICAIVAGIVAGVLPGWFSRNTDLAYELRAGSRSATLSPAALRWQQAMVVLQAALSVVILAAAALVGVSFRNLSRVSVGFDPGSTLIAHVQLQAPEYAKPAVRVAFGRTLLDNLSREPAIAAAAFTSTLPVGDDLWGSRFFIQLPDGSPSPEAMLLHFRRTSSNYLATIGIPLVAGRPFDAHDDSTTPPVAIVSRSLARRLWPNESAVGKRLFRVVTGSKVPSPLDVVGVAGDAMDAGTSAPPGEVVYVPWEQVSVTRLSLVIQPRGTDAAALTAVRHALRLTDPVLAAHNVARLETLVHQANALPRLQSLLLLTFAIAAMTLAGLGSYGVMSQLVATREREYALRLVFGAAPGALGRAVLGQVARLTIPGVLVGLLVVLLLGGTLRRFVFGVEPRSALVLSCVSVGMLLLAVVATLPSVIRAMRTDPRRSLTPS